MRTLEISGLDGEAPGDIVGAIAGEAGVEAGVVARVARAAVEAGLDPGEVAVVTPYDDQRDRLRRALATEDLEVDTVDGVQGREKEVVLVSFVRNPDDELGFLTDLRRLNVAPARARRKLVLVGDAGTLGSHPAYAGLLDAARERGRVLDPG